MPVYRYKVRDKFGKLVKGTIGGDNKDAVAFHFESMGYTPVSILEETPAQQLPFLNKIRRVKQEDINLFNRQMVTLIKAGLPLLSSLNAVMRQTKNGILRDVIQVIIRDIEGGSSFSDALSHHPYLFNEMYVNTIKAGELGGALDEILARLAELGEYDANTKAKIKAATRYPMIAVTVLCIGVFILVTYVIPRFSAIFAGQQVMLPLPTRILIWLNNAIRNYWYMAIALVVLSVFLFNRLINTKKGRRIWDGLRLKIPIFGPLVFMIMMSRFSRITAIMLRSGVPILGALDMVANTTGNVVIGEAVRDIMKSINEGGGMAEPMARSKVFSPMVAQMVAIGEETGNVDELLLHVSEHYDRQSNYMIQNLTTMIEPILVVILGCVVLVLALAIFLPMWNMIGLFRR